MVSRHVINQLSQRLDALASRFAPPDPPIEVWIAEGNKAWRTGASKDDAIAYTELEARPTRRRIVVTLAHAEPGGMGWAAPCCLPGGQCYALHGDSGGNRPPGWTPRPPH